MNGVEEVSISSGSGYRLTFKLESDRGLRDDGNVQYRGQGGNYPYGELAFTPDATSVNGFLEVNVAVGGIGRLPRPLVLEFENGRVINIKGDDAARYMEFLAKADKVDEQMRSPGNALPSPYYLGEFGVGLNGGIQPYNEDGGIRPDLTSLEAEKILGTIHLALGQTPIPWAKIKNDSSTHSDMVVSGLTMRVRKRGESDFTTVMESGELKL